MMKFVARNFGIIVGLILVAVLSLFNYSEAGISIVIATVIALILTLINFYIGGDISKKLMIRLIRYDMLIGFCVFGNYVAYITYTVVK